MSEQKRPPQVTVKLFIATAINEYTMKALDTGAPMFPTEAHKILDDAIDKAYDAWEKDGVLAGLTKNEEKEDA